MDDDTSLTLSIGAVSRATGIPSNTLRTWERRYGFPLPLRTDGGQRIYPAALVGHLTDIARALDRGLRPRDVLTASREDLRRWTLPDAIALHGDELGPLLISIRALDANALSRAFEIHWARLGSVVFLDQVVIPLRARIAKSRTEHALESFHERFSVEILTSFLSHHWRPLADSARGPVAICASISGEVDRIGPHLAASTLALTGRRAILLGSDTNIREIRGAAAAVSAESVAISLFAPLPDREQRLRELRRALPERVSLLLTGPAAPDLDGAVQLPTCAALERWASTTS